jgi:hypothetical protein
MNINLNLPETIIFHPGIGKTATSAIQNIGFKLPTDDNLQACFSPYGFYGGASNYFASNHPDFSLSNYQNNWDSLLKFAKNKGGSTVVSSEFLIRDNPQHIANMLKEIKSEGINVKVIVAVRNYTDYLISAYLQAVKVNWGLQENEDVFKYCKRELAQIRMPLLIDNWAKHIGDENVFLMDYDKDKQNFVRLFFETIDIKIDSNDGTKAKINESIRLEIAPMLRHFDRITSNKQQREQFIQYLNSLDYKDQYAKKIRQRIENTVVRNAFIHDKERLTVRYTWL